MNEIVENYNSESSEPNNSLDNDSGYESTYHLPKFLFDAYEFDKEVCRKILTVMKTKDGANEIRRIRRYFKQLCADGCVLSCGIIQLMVELLSLSRTTLAAGLKEAAVNGHINVVEYIIEISTNGVADILIAFEGACMGLQTNTIEFMLNKYSSSLDIIDYKYIILTSIKYSRAQILRMILNKIDVKTINRLFGVNDILTAMYEGVGRNGDMFNYVCSIPWLNITRRINKAFFMSMKSQNTLYYTRSVYTVYHNNVVDGICDNLNISDILYCIKCSTQMADTTIFMWMWLLWGEMITNHNLKMIFNGAIITNSNVGIEMCNLIHNGLTRSGGCAQILENIFKGVCKNKLVPKSILVHIYNFCIQQKVSTLACFGGKNVKILCLNNNVECLEWFVEMGANLTLRGPKKKIFYEACKYNQLELAKLIYNYGDNHKYININCKNGALMRYACCNGGLKLAQWLYSKCPTINIHGKNDYAFEIACTYGFVDIVKWLLENFPTINFRRNNDVVFTAAVINGYYSTVKYLYEKSPDINIQADGHYLFKVICESYNPDDIRIAELFVSKYPEIYSIEILFGQIVNHTINLNLKISSDKANISKIEECSICYSEEPNIITECNHQFCYNCLNEWFNKNNICPNCRKIVTKCSAIECPDTTLTDLVVESTSQHLTTTNTLKDDEEDEEDEEDDEEDENAEYENEEEDEEKVFELVVSRHKNNDEDDDEDDED